MDGEMAHLTFESYLPGAGADVPPALIEWLVLIACHVCFFLQLTAVVARPKHKKMPRFQVLQWTPCNGSNCPGMGSQMPSEMCSHCKGIPHL